MLTFDDLIRSSRLVFDDLDGPFTDGYEQSGVPVLVVSGDGAQEIVEIIEQALDVQVIVSSDSPQEWVSGAWTAVAYLQGANARLLTFTLATQEHVPVFGGINGQTGNAMLTLLPVSYQAYLAGAGAGDILQQASVSLYFDPIGVQLWYPQSISIAAYLSATEVAPFASSDPTEILAQFNGELQSVSQVRLTFSSTDPDWDAGIGPLGGPMAVEVAVRVGQSYLPLVSLRRGRDSAVFFEGDRFEALRTAILAGAAQFRLGGFESLEQYAAPRSLLGTSVLGVEAVS